MKLSELFTFASKSVECCLCHRTWLSAPGHAREPVELMRESFKSSPDLWNDDLTKVFADMAVVYKCAECGTLVCQVCFLRVSNGCIRSSKHVNGYALRVVPNARPPRSRRYAFMDQQT
jgi:hypothetical protein